MSKPTTAEKIGGEYGDVRAAIDVEKLNVYLGAHVPEVAPPVTLKQFEVRICVRFIYSNCLTVLLDSVWTGTLCRSAPTVS